MSSSLRVALWALATAVALAGPACGRYGPPVRARERAAAERQQKGQQQDPQRGRKESAQPESPATDESGPISDPPVDPEDPVVPGPEPEP